MGFPGEDEADAGEVASFVEESDLDWVGVFAYSREEGTRSYSLDAQVPEALVRERVDLVSSAGERAMARRTQSFVGSTMEVLVERLDLEEKMWVGRSQREAPEVDGEIRFASVPPPAVGDYVSVRITGSEGADLIGTSITSG